MDHHQYLLPIGKINKLPIGINLSSDYLNDEKCLLVSQEIEKIINGGGK